MTRRTRVVGVAALFALGVVFWVHRIHVDRPTTIDFGVADLIHLYEPFARHLHREYTRGELPLWNPYQLAGVPLLALHHAGVLYPPNVALFGLLPPPRALEAHAVLHLGLAGAGAWVFAARLGLGAPAAAAAALAFMLSAPLLKAVYNPSSLATMAWVPWLLAAVDGLVRARTRPFAAAVAMSAALAFLAGYAQGTVYAVQVAAAYGVLATFLWAPRGTRGRVARLALLAAALAVGLVAAQLLPTLELVSRGVRGLGGLTLAQAGYGSLEPAALLSPWVLGDPGTWRGVSWITWRAASVPLVALPLAVAALAGRPWRALGLFFVLVAGLAGLLMLGPQAWVYRAYHTLPLGGLFRVPVRFDFVYAFAVALLIGLGAQTVQEAVARRRGVRAGTAVALLLAAAVGGERWARSRLPFTHPAIADPASYESRAFAELLREDPERRRGFVVEGQMLTWKLGTRHGVPAVPDYDAVLPSEYERYFTGGSGGGYHPWHGDLRLAGPPWGFGRPGRPPADVVRLLDLMSVGLYAIDPTTPASWRRDIEALLGGPSRRLGRGHVVARPEALPRAYVVHEVVVEPDRDRALGILLDPAFDARRRAVVEGAPASLAASAAAEPVRLVDESPTGLTVSATCAAPCLLVTTDLAYPGWRATVDGRPTEIVTANVLYRGVRLGPGAHEIVFRYRPGSFFVGATVSFASIGVLIWMLSRRARA